jgi:ATP-binding cassette subfamily F protein uup
MSITTSTTPLFSLDEAMVSFGGKPLFTGIGFSIFMGDKICLVGRNGCGKSTLIKIIVGDLELDGGERFLHPDARVGYLPQKVPVVPGQTVYEYVLKDLPKELYGEDPRHVADKIFSFLEVTGEKYMEHLSGGQLRRAALAKALIEEPDILLLDEPTNHLDIGAIEWLEGYIKRFKGAVICISHDRAFLSTISTRTFWLDRGQIRVNGTGYGDFERWSTDYLEAEANRLQKMSKKLDRENEWLYGGGVTARRKRNQHRLQKLVDLRHRLRKGREGFNFATNKVVLPELSPDKRTKMIIEMEGVSKSFDDHLILDHMSIRIMQGERIGIVGKNGSGKSTFLKIFTGDLEADKGTIRRGRTFTEFQEDIAYFDQNRESLNPDLTLWETLCPGGGDTVFVGGKRPRHVVAYLKDFMFDPKLARMPTGALSGGEANRLLLSKIMLNPSSILVLDEPTNDLDMDTLDMLQELLSDYKGTLLIVSHDRDFLDRVATHTMAFEGNGEVGFYVGGYSDYLAQKRETQEKVSAQKQEKKEKQPRENKPKSTKLTFKQQFALDNLPMKISELGMEIEEIEEELSDPQCYADDPERFYALSERLVQAKAEVVAAEEELLEVMMLAEGESSSQ